MKKVSESVAQEFKLEEVVRNPRVGSDETEPDKVTSEQAEIDQKLMQKLQSENAKKEAI